MIYGSVYDSINESTLLDVAPYEFDESMTFQEMGAQMIEEATQDWNDYMQAVALTELSYVIENHQEYIYEGVDIRAMIDKVKDWFKKLWAKIQGIAKAALAKFASWGKNDEGFINKYEKDIYDGAKKLPTGFSYKGYKFPDLSGKASNVKGSGDSVANRFVEKATSLDDLKVLNGKTFYDDKQTKDEISNDTKSVVDYHRGSIVGKNNSKFTSSEFKKELKVYLYGSADKEYIKDVNAGSLIGIVKGAKEAISNAKEAESAAKESIDDKIEVLDKLESSIKDYSNDNVKPEEAELRNRMSNRASIINKYSSVLKEIETVNAQFFSAYITALKDQNRQAKAICTKLISYANGVGGKKPTNESVGSLLEDRFAALEF